MNILITGATGLIGRALVLRLQSEGHHLTAWVRSVDSARNKLGDNVTLVGHAPMDSLELERAVARADAVINLAGEPILGRRWNRRHLQAVRESRVGLTRTLVGAMTRSDKPPATLISASAVGFYGPDVREPVDESAASGAGFVAELCRDWEAEAQRAASLGTRVVPLRIGIVLDREGGALTEMLPFFRWGLGGRLGHGHQYVPWIHLDDMVETIAFALHEPTLRGPVNAVAAADSNRALTRVLARSLRRPATVIPGFALRATVGRGASLMLGGQNVVPRALAERGFDFQYPTLDVAIEDILSDHRQPLIQRVQELPSSPYLERRGARYRLSQRTVIDAPLEQVFDFFSDATNLAPMTPPALAFEIESPRPIDMHAGTTIDYRIKLGPVPMRWRTGIEVWEPGVRFVDAQLEGPYRSWWHEHRFMRYGGQTLMQDTVYYSLPFGPVGWMTHRLQVAPMLHRIFEFRARAIARRFHRGSSAASARASEQLGHIA